MPTRTQSPPRVSCVSELVEAWARRTPDAPAVRARDGSCSYRVLNRRAEAVAQALRAAGVGAEDRVVLCLSRTTAAIAAIVGTLKTGAAYAPLDPGQPEERLAALVLSTAPAAVVTERGAALRLPPCVPRIDVDDLLEEAAPSHAWQRTPASAAYVIYTSGSTGAPKGVVVERRQLLAYLRGLARLLGLPTGASYASVSPLWTDLGHTAIFGALSTGGAVHLLDEATALSPSALAETFARDVVDCLKATPSYLAAMAGWRDGARLLPRRRLVLGGEHLHWDVLDRVRSLAPELVVVNHYGPTECTVGVAAAVADPADRSVAATVPVAPAVPGTRLHVLDGDLAPVGEDEEGELYVEGASVARGYLGDRAKTASAFPYVRLGGSRRRRTYRTGDLVRRLTGGRIEILGRVDRQLNVRGLRVEPAEIEAALLAHPQVSGARVVPVQVAAGLELVAFAAAGPGARPEELRRFVAERLPRMLVPNRVEVLDSLPLGPTGKVDDAVLAATATPAG